MGDEAVGVCGIEHEGWRFRDRVSPTAPGVTTSSAAARGWSGQHTVGEYRRLDQARRQQSASEVLLLHGGPGTTHEYLEVFESHLPDAGIEFYYYDQLGSGNSDSPDDESLWDLDRYVDESSRYGPRSVSGRSDFVLYGHSWGGLLALEYALAHQEQLRGSSCRT